MQQRAFSLRLALPLVQILRGIGGSARLVGGESAFATDRSKPCCGHIPREERALGRFLVQSKPLFAACPDPEREFARVKAGTPREVTEAEVSRQGLQGYLAHKKQPPPP